MPSFDTSNYTLTAAVSGSGTVMSSDLQINCGASCSALYLAGTQVTFTASPGAGAIFTGWSGGNCSGSKTCTVTLSANTTVTATFGSSAAPTAPAITVQPVSQTVLLTESATFTVMANGTGPFTYHWYKNGAAISGATFPSYTTPPAAVADNGSSFTVTVTSPTGNATSNAATLKVNLLLALPSAASTSLPLAEVGVSYSATLTASGGVPSYTWMVNDSALSTGGIPTALANGLSVSNNGGLTLTISGSPTTAGTGGVKASITDQASYTAGPVTYALTIYPQLTLGSVSLPAGEVGAAYNSGALTATGGNGTYTWNATGLPSWASINASTGAISGATPTQGTSSVTVKVSDSLGGTASSQPLMLAINPALSIATSSLPNGTVGLPYGATLSTSGGAPTYTWSLSSGSLPAGLNLSSSGIISGTPASPSGCTGTGTPPTCSFTVQVKDNLNVTKTATLTIGISLADNTNKAYLYGHYAFAFRGIVNKTSGSGELYQSAAVGSFYADGNGNIANGLVDIADGNGASFTGALPFYGTYSIGADSRGIMTICAGVSSGNCTSWLTSNFANSNHQSNSFIFSAGQIQTVNLGGGSCPTGGPSTNNSTCPVYTDGFMIEADDVGAPPSYAQGSARLFRQSYGNFSSLPAFNNGMIGCSSSGCSGSPPPIWVFTLQGEDVSFNSVVAGGVFTATNDSSSSCTGGSPNQCNGNITTGITDINDNNQNVMTSVGLSASGAWQTTPASSGAYTTSNGRFKLSTTTTNAPATYPSDYIGYMISNNELLLISSDSHNSSGSGGTNACNGGSCMLVSGHAYRQHQGSYGDSSLNDSFVVYTHGPDDPWLAQMSCSSGNCTVNASDENKNGAYTQNGMTGALQTAVFPGGTGRMTFGTLGQNGASPVIVYFLRHRYQQSARGIHSKVVLTVDDVKTGEMKIQGAIPGSMAGSAPVNFYTGTLVDLAVSNTPNNNSGAAVVGIDSSFTMTTDTAGQGSTSWDQVATGLS